MSGNVIEFPVRPAGERKSMPEVDQLAKDAVEFAALAKDIRAMSGAVDECRGELRKIATANPRLAKADDPAEARLAKMDGMLVDIARRLDRMAKAPIPLPLLARRKEPA